MFKRLYEDNVLGRINNEQSRMLSCGYTDEQKSIDAKLPELEKTNTKFTAGGKQCG